MTSFELSQKTVNLTPYPRPLTAEGEEREELTDALLKWLLRERGMIAAFSATAEKKRALIRAAMNERPAHPVPQEVLAMQDRLFWAETLERGIVEEKDLSFGANGIGLWQGDITRLAVDGIVNAANRGLLGCFLPGHNCIDNVIHSAAGMQLRDDCAKLIAAQGREEECGDCKITRAYNLPSRYVLHTVGPMIRREVTERDRGLLRACYRACLDTAAEAGLKSIAFCCISTGVFSFPRAEAAELAAGAVLQWKMRNKDVPVRILFNTFLDEDTRIYKSILSMA